MSPIKTFMKQDVRKWKNSLKIQKERKPLQYFD